MSYWQKGLDFLHVKIIVTLNVFLMLFWNLNLIFFKELHILLFSHPFLLCVWSEMRAKQILFNHKTQQTLLSKPLLWSKCPFIIDYGRIKLECHVTYDHFKNLLVTGVEPDHNTTAKSLTDYFKQTFNNKFIENLGKGFYCRIQSKFVYWNSEECP